MVPRDHGFGTSFKGVSAYLLHDKDKADTAERVAWTHCHNLGTQNAETAFRVMAAVALDQTRLKQMAHERAQADLPEEERKAFRNSGRKSSDHVWHYSLSWSPEEAEGLSQEEMIEAAKASLSVLGKDKTKAHPRRQFADEHQAVFVCHADEGHPHVHVVVNRVHQEHGNMLSKYNDWQRFSRWAQQYEEERGQVYCTQRVANNQLRDQLKEQGKQIKVYGKGHLPHHLADSPSIERQAANDNINLVQRVAERERLKAAELAKRGREQAEKQREELQSLQEQYQARRKAIREELVRKSQLEQAKIYAQRQNAQKHIIEEQRLAAEVFAIREKDLAGKARNIWETVKAQWQVRNTEDRQFKLSDYYKPITGEAARLEAFRAAQYAEQREFEIAREKAIRAAIAPLQRHAAIERQNARVSYTQEQERLKADHAKQADLLKEQWHQHNLEREKALQAAQEIAERAKSPPTPQIADRFNQAAQDRPQAASEDGGGKSQERHQAPQSQDDAARLKKSALEEFKKRMQQKREDSKGRDPDRER